METYKLIDSEYNAIEAREVIGYLMDTKIKFLCRKRFSMQERSDGDTSHIDNRIAELQQAREDLSNSMALNQVEGKLLKIDCEIRVEETAISGTNANKYLS